MLAGRAGKNSEGRMTVAIIGFVLLLGTMFVQLTWMIFFCAAEDGPPPDWSRYPIPPAFLLIFIGIGWSFWN